MQTKIVFLKLVYIAKKLTQYENSGNLHIDLPKTGESPSGIMSQRASNLHN